MKTVIFFYRNMNIGGCQLLIMKLTKEMLHRNIHVVICCEFMDEDLRISDENLDILELGSHGWVSDKIIRKNIMCEEPKVYIMTFLWNDYARIYALKLKNARILFYAVHFQAIASPAYSWKGIFKDLKRLYLRRIVKKCIHENSIIAMDEQTIRYTTDFYKMGLTDVSIIRIPIEYTDTDFNLDAAVNKFDLKERNILAVARAEFPFKGYLLGLIKAISNGSVPENFNLTIVSYGQDIVLLENLYESLNSDIKSRIRLIGRTNYSELKKLFDMSHVYVGMGTTLLDASKYGVISLPVVPYSYQVLCNDFFHSHPEDVALSNGCEEKFVALLRKINKLDSEKAAPMVRECQRLVKEIYSVSKSVDDLLLAFEKVGMNIIPDIFAYYRMFQVKRFLARQKKKFI